MQEQLPLSGWEVRGDLACLLCSRIVASAQGPRAKKFIPASVRVLRAEHASAVQQMRCPYCSGRLWLQDTEEIFVDRRPLSAEELRPRRGRPPKVRPAADQPAARAS
jgi:DNA-directed RNA polymerase subunit RPC12/RpoP